MRQCLLIIVLFFSNLLGFSQHIDLCKIDKMNGLVKSVVISEWDEDTTGTPKRINRTFFDREGRAVKASYERPNSLKKEVIITYNEDGLISKEKYYSSDEDTTYKSHFYDTEKRLVRLETQSETESQPHFVIEYTYTPQLIVEEKFYADRTFCAYEETHLNSDGKDSLVIKKDEKGKVLYQTKYFYFDEGRQELRNYSKGKSNKIESYCKTYYQADTIFIDSCFTGDGTLKDNVKIIDYAFGEVYYMKFDLISDDLHDESINEYVFDDQGNWIKRISYLHGEFWFMKEQEITYFE